MVANLRINAYWEGGEGGEGTPCGKWSEQLEFDLKCDSANVATTVV